MFQTHKNRVCTSKYATPFLLEMDRDPPVKFNAMLCGELCGPDVATGSEAGDIYLWHTFRGEVSQRIAAAHDSPISALACTGETIISGDFNGGFGAR